MKSRLGLIPIILVIVTAIAFFSSYFIAVFRKDVNPWWPYISDTGTTVPESCIFGQLLNLTAAIAFVTMYIRYKLVQAFNNHDIFLRRLNQISLFIGILSSLGVSLVANFQESSVIAVHVTGAFMAFGLGVAYCFLHTAITKRMYPMYNGFSIWVYRLTISLLGLLALILTSVFGAIATEQKEDASFQNFSNLHWNSTEAGYDEHVVSTVSEWMIGVAFLAYFLTYVKDFQKITVRILPELLVSHLDEVPIVFNSGPTERTGLLA